MKSPHFFCWPHIFLPQERLWECGDWGQVGEYVLCAAAAICRTKTGNTESMFRPCLIITSNNTPGTLNLVRRSWVESKEQNTFYAKNSLCIVCFKISPCTSPWVHTGLVVLTPSSKARNNDNKQAIVMTTVLWPAVSSALLSWTETPDYMVNMHHIR